MLTPDQQAALNASAIRVHDAEAALRNAYDEYHSAIDRHLSLQLSAHTNPQRFLLNIIMCNNSEWSGGPHSLTNVMEGIRRNAATYLLNTTTKG